MHAMDALPNFMTVWISIAVMFWNLYRANPPSTFSLPIDGMSYLLYVIVIPIALMLGGYYMLRPAQPAVAAPPEENEEEDV